MITRLQTWASLLTALGVAACTRPPEPQVHSVAYYREHAKERAAMIRACRDNPGQLRSEPNCINAIEAESIEGIGSFRDLPPMQLNKPKQQNGRGNQD